MGLLFHGLLVSTCRVFRGLFSTYEICPRPESIPKTAHLNFKSIQSPLTDSPNLEDGNIFKGRSGGDSQGKISILLLHLGPVSDDPRFAAVFAIISLVD